MNHKTHTTKAEGIKAAGSQDDSGAIGSGYAKGLQHGAGSRLDQDRRVTALSMALDLHRGKDKPADKIVEEAEVFDKFLRGGPDPDAEGR